MLFNIVYFIFVPFSERPLLLLLCYLFSLFITQLNKGCFENEYARIWRENNVTRVVCLFVPLTHRTRELVSLSKSTFEFWRLFQEFLNRYQACLYLSEYIFHGDSKYNHQITDLWYFLKLDETFDLSSADFCRVKNIT